MKLNKDLSLEENVKNNLKEKRYIHVLSVANLSKKLAIIHNLDANKAYVAGLLHDIAKGLSFEENVEILKNVYPELLKMPSYAYHAYASEYLAKKYFDINDEEILKAIFNHTRPVKNMSLIEKIVFFADKIEETRAFANETKDLRELAEKDIDLTFIKTMEYQLKYLDSLDGQEADVNTYEMLNYYKKEYLNGR